MIVIDADEAVLGRLASQTAKQLLNGEKVVIVNAEKAVISGSRKSIYKRYKQKFDRSNRANPLKATKFSRVPDRIVRGTVRGMINHKTTRGSKAYKSLKVFMGVPEEYDGKVEKFPGKPPQRKLAVLELAKMLGWKGGE